MAGWVGRAILLEKTCNDVDVDVDAGDAGEVGEADSIEDVVRTEVITVVVAGTVG